MKLQTHSVHFTADQKLLDFIQQKANKLDTFYDHIISGEVYLKLSTEKENQNNDKIVEIKLFVPGTSLFVKAEQPSFEAATDVAIEAMKAQLRKLKDKLRNHPNVEVEQLIPQTEEVDSDLE